MVAGKGFRRSAEVGETSGRRRGSPAFCSWRRGGAVWPEASGGVAGSFGSGRAPAKCEGGGVGRGLGRRGGERGAVAEGLYIGGLGGSGKVRGERSGRGDRVWRALVRSEERRVGKECRL